MSRKFIGVASWLVSNIASIGIGLLMIGNFYVITLINNASHAQEIALMKAMENVSKDFVHKDDFKPTVDSLLQADMRQRDETAKLADDVRENSKQVAVIRGRLGSMKQN